MINLAPPQRQPVEGAGRLFADASSDLPRGVYYACYRWQLEWATGAFDMMWIVKPGPYDLLCLNQTGRVWWR